MLLVAIGAPDLGAELEAEALAGAEALALAAEAEVEAAADAGSETAAEAAAEADLEAAADADAELAGGLGHAVSMAATAPPGTGSNARQSKSLSESTYSRRPRLMRYRSMSRLAKR